MDKYLFLDVDGVLNNYDTSNTCKGFTTFSDELLENLSRITNVVEVKVVLSSDWRLFENPSPTDILLHDLLINTLRKYNIEIYSQTGRMLWNRGREIKAWFAKHDIDWHETTFVILDDMPPQEFEDLNDHLVCTNWVEGLSLEDVAKAIDILSNQTQEEYFILSEQVEFLDPTTNKPCWMGGIAIEDNIICGCCGHKFKQHDLFIYWKEHRNEDAFEGILSPIKLRGWNCDLSEAIKKGK